MTDTELIQLRRDKWRLNGNSVRTLEDARSFIESVGFCLMLPLPAPRTSLVPTFVGACLGSDDKLPTQRNALTDPRARDATELMVRLLRDKSAYEANLGDENNALLLSASAFPYFYTLVGERNPKQAPHPARGHHIRSWLATPIKSFSVKVRFQNRSCWKISAKAFRYPRWINLSANYGRSCASRASITTSAKARHGTCCSAGRRRRCPRASIVR